MAFTIVRALPLVMDSVEIAAGATEVSDPVDLGDDTLYDQARLYVRVADWIAAPGGNELVHVILQPIHTALGDPYDGNVIQLLATADADQEYLWSWPIDSLPRHLTVAVHNDTGQATAAPHVSVWIELIKVTS